MVRSSVSSTTSASHQPSPTATTVRQQPLTAIESPMLDVRRARCVAPMRKPVAVVATIDGAELLDDAGEHQQRSIVQVDAEVVARGGRRRRCGRARRRRWWRRRGRRTGPGVVAAEQRGREVDDVAVDQAGAVEARRRRWRRPRPAPARRPGARARRARSPRSPSQLEAGWTVAPSGARPSTTRSGSRPSTWRTVSAGSSARTVPAPTTRRRSRPAGGGRRRRGGSPVIHWLVPSGAAVRPSSVAASLSTT